MGINKFPNFFSQGLLSDTSAAWGEFEGEGVWFLRIPALNPRPISQACEAVSVGKTVSKKHGNFLIFFPFYTHF